MPSNQIQYSEKYYDDVYEYRYVKMRSLSKPFIARCVPVCLPDVVDL